MSLDIKKIQREHIFWDKSFREIGQELGVTKQYLSFQCSKHRNDPSKIYRELLEEFDQIKGKIELHQQLKIKRRLLQLTQKDIAQKVGTHASVVTRIENGELLHSIFISRMQDYLEL